MRDVLARVQDLGLVLKGGTAFAFAWGPQPPFDRLWTSMPSDSVNSGTASIVPRKLWGEP